jgi:hypothetical protein
MRSSAVVLAIVTMISVWSCVDELAPIAPSRQSLSDPSIMPVVTFTLPGRAAVGPFHLYNNGDFSDRPHFIIQFNKYIDETMIEPGMITVWLSAARSRTHMGIRGESTVQHVRYFRHFRV